MSHRLPLREKNLVDWPPEDKNKRNRGLFVVISLFLRGLLPNAFVTREIGAMKAFPYHIVVTKWTYFRPASQA
jgi:hypothetical protein